ncbi:hypothetical protein [Vandammella animalimorsus]|nr:hypothetical protein [Vandammella animalimorsus]
MDNWAFVLVLLRLALLFVGAVVVLMWLAGCLGLADFRLIFVVPEVAGHG